MFDLDLGELLRFIAFVTPPIIVGTVLVRAVMHLWARWTGRKPRVSPWPVAMMLVMVLIPVLIVDSAEREHIAWLQQIFGIKSKVRTASGYRPSPSINPTSLSVGALRA